MARLLALSLLLAAALGLAGAQTTTTTTTNEALDLDSRAPQENASSGWVSQRAPGTWVRAAISRHSQYIGARVNGPRFGEFSDLLLAGINASGSGNSGTRASGGIMGLLNQFGDVTDLVNTFAGTGGTTTSGSSGTSLEDLIAIRDYYAALEGESTTETTEKRVNRSSTAQTRNGYTFGGAIARLPKAEERFQDTDTTTDEPKFVTRLVTAWVDTFFDSISLAFLTPQFRELLADGLRPLLLPDADDDDDNNNGSGDSIDDIDGTDGGSNGGGSTI